MKSPISIWRILLAMAAYAYLLYVLITFQHYQELAMHFASAGWKEWGALALCLALFPINIACEAWKWKALVNDLEKISIQEAQKQVYFGCVAAFLTPQRLGDYPARASRLKEKAHWMPAITLGFIGSMALTTVNILGGVTPIATLISRQHHVISQASLPLPAASVAIWSAFILVLCLLLLFALPALSRWLTNKRKWSEKMQIFLDFIGKFPPARFPYLCVQSACRWAVFCLQLSLALFFCGVQNPAILLLGIPFYYMLVTVMPSFPAADAAIRGSIGVIAFSTFFTAPTASVALAIIIVWMINTLLPVIVGTFMTKK